MTFVLFILRRAHARLNMSNLKKKDSLVILLLQILKTLETAEKNVDMRYIYLSKDIE